MHTYILTKQGHVNLLNYKEILKKFIKPIISKTTEYKSTTKTTIQIYRQCSQEIAYKGSALPIILTHKTLLFYYKANYKTANTYSVSAM